MPKNQSTTETSISTQGLRKSFTIGESTEEVLKGIDIEISHKDFMIIFGQSGSGKSTLLNILIGLERPSTGTVVINGVNIAPLPEDKLATMRAQHFGIVTQQPIWAKALSVLENVALPLLLSGYPRKEAYSRAGEALTMVGMDNYLHHRPTEISGGQQQRVALARALVVNPDIIVLDEPTGNLDTKSADQILALLQMFHAKFGKVVIMATHNLHYLPYATTTVEIVDGVVEQKTGKQSCKKS